MCISDDGLSSAVQTDGKGDIPRSYSKEEEEQISQLMATHDEVSDNPSVGNKVSSKRTADSVVHDDLHQESLRKKVKIEPGAADHEQSLEKLRLQIEQLHAEKERAVHEKDALRQSYLAQKIEAESAQKNLKQILEVQRQKDDEKQRRQKLKKLQEDEKERREKEERRQQELRDEANRRLALKQEKDKETALKDTSIDSGISVDHPQSGTSTETLLDAGLDTSQIAYLKRLLAEKKTEDLTAMGFTADILNKLKNIVPQNPKKPLASSSPVTEALSKPVSSISFSTASVVTAPAFTTSTRPIPKVNLFPEASIKTEPKDSNGDEILGKDLLTSFVKESTPKKIKEHKQQQQAQKAGDAHVHRELLCTPPLSPSHKSLKQQSEIKSIKIDDVKKLLSGKLSKKGVEYVHDEVKDAGYTLVGNIHKFDHSFWNVMLAYIDNVPTERTDNHVTLRRWLTTFIGINETNFSRVSTLSFSLFDVK